MVTIHWDKEQERNKGSSPGLNPNLHSDLTGSGFLQLLSFSFYSMLSVISDLSRLMSPHLISPCLVFIHFVLSLCVSSHPCLIRSVIQSSLAATSAVYNLTLAYETSSVDMWHFSLAQQRFLHQFDFIYWESVGANKLFFFYSGVTYPQVLNPSSYECIWPYFFAFMFSDLYSTCFLICLRMRFNHIQSNLQSQEWNLIKRVKEQELKSLPCSAGGGIFPAGSRPDPRHTAVWGKGSWQWHSHTQDTSWTDLQPLTGRLWNLHCSVDISRWGR